MKIRLIASDLDGTLLTDQKVLSPETEKALKMAAERGIHIVPATGRSFHAVPDIVKQFTGVEYVITANGGAVYRVSSGERIYQCLLEDEAVKAVLEMEKPEKTALEVFIGGTPYSEEAYVQSPMDYGATEYGAGYVRRTRVPVNNMRKFAEAHSNELDSMAFVCADPEEKRKLCRRLLRDIPGIYVTSSVPNLVEIGHEKAGKGNTLRYLLNRLGISPQEAMAFGDADNDISMLSAVKYGIAMENGTQACREAAAFLTASNQEDGVAKMIFSFLQVDE